MEEATTYADCTMPIIGDALELIELRERAVPEGAMAAKSGTNLTRVNRILAGFLKVKLKGKAAIWLKSLLIGDGIRAWKAMLHKYDPLTGSTRLDLHNKITAAPTRCAGLKDVPAALERWEGYY